ncbi:MAG: hypothetical protein ACFFEW_14660 [Candidatus Thorarchaeota archaeon]
MEVAQIHPSEVVEKAELEKEEAHVILHPALTFFGLILIGLAYLLSMPLRWSFPESLVFGYPILLLGVLCFLFLLQFTIQRISLEAVMVLSSGISDAAGLVILLHPLTLFRGYVEPEQPFGFGFGIQTANWPLFVIFGVSVLLVSRKYQKSVELDKNFLKGLMGLLGVIVIILSWISAPLLLEVTPSHIAGIFLVFESLMLYLSKI